MAHQRIRTVCTIMILLLGLSGCASKAPTKTAQNPTPEPRTAVVNEPVSATDRPMATECTSHRDARGNIVYDDPSCPTRTRRSDSREMARDTTPCNRTDLTSAVATECTSHRDASGNIVYDDPACAARIAKTECTSHRDASGNIVYDDPACAARIAKTECTSHRDARGNIVYDDPSCPTRNRRPDSPEMAQDPASYDRQMDAAVAHVRKAEIAGDNGNIPEMLRDASLSLDQAKGARMTGANPDLNAGIMDLRETLIVGCRDRIAPSALRDAMMKLERAASVRRTSHVSSRTLTGELRRTGGAGEDTYIVRDRQYGDTPVFLSPDMSGQIKEGDVVQAQVDPQGRVVAISKYPE